MTEHVHPYAVLAIDPGKVSGWALYVEGYYHASGVARTHADRLGACTSARDVAEAANRPLVIVAEKWTPGGRFAGARTMAGLGESMGLWRAAIEEAEIPASRVLRVNTQTWRAAVLGGGRGVTSRQWDALAQRVARNITRCDDVDDNEADAICIAEWAFRVPGRTAIDPKLPKKFRRTA